MEVPLNICLTCLSTDRNLVPLHKITMLLQEIHFVELKQCLGGVCWECRSILGTFYRFKKKAELAQDMLSKMTQNFKILPLTTLVSKVNTLYDYEYKYSLDPLTTCNIKLKAEPESIKQEILDQSDIVDNNSDFDEKKSEIDEETENVFSVILEEEKGGNLLKNQVFINQCDCGIDNITDLEEKYLEIDEKLSVIPGKTENENKHRLKKQKCSHCDNRVKNNFDKATIRKHNKEMTEKVYVETIEKNTNKTILKKRTKKDIERDKREFEDKFTQIVLSEEEMRKAREDKRNHYNFKKIPFKCDSCVLGFTREDTFNLHRRKKHDKSIGNEICDVCSIRFRHRLALNNHRVKHYVVYRCRLCRYEGHDFVSVVNHCRTKHVDDEPEKIHCSRCDVVVRTPEDLEKHMQNGHTLFCDCGVKFKDKNNLRRHMSRAHSVLRSFICDICKKTFKTKSRLETHMATHDEDIAKKLAFCQQCNVQYKNIQVYRIHLKSSSNHSEGYPCSECNKKFRSKGYLRQHYNFYHLRKSPYKCEVCNKLFISNWRLHNHKQQYHGVNRPRNHSCNTCSKKFFTQATLRSHQLTHSSQRSFMCSDCGDTFKQSAALYTHTRLVHKRGAKRKDI